MSVGTTVVSWRPRSGTSRTACRRRWGRPPQLVQLVEGGAVGGAVTGDGKGLAGPRQRCQRVVDGAVAEQRRCLVGIEPLRPPTPCWTRRSSPMRGIRRRPIGSPVLRPRPKRTARRRTHLRRRRVRARVEVAADDARREGGTLLAIRRVESRLLHLGVGRRPEGVGEHEPAGDQEQVADEPQPARPPAVLATGRRPLGRGVVWSIYGWYSRQRRGATPC